MSELAIFSIGCVIFAVTVYGAVMTGGLLFTRRENVENEDVRGGVDDAMTVTLPGDEDE